MTTIVTAMAMAMVMMTSTQTTTTQTYVRTMEVMQLDYEQDIVTCVDAVGYEWQFYGCEDYAEHDLVSCVMDTRGTEETILDDAIIDTYYTGYWRE